jgi:hypothetical protein
LNCEQQPIFLLTDVHVYYVEDIKWGFARNGLVSQAWNLFLNLKTIHQDNCLVGCDTT